MGILGRNSFSKLALIIILFVAQWHLQTVRIPNDNWKNIIVSDGTGYYGYLPAIFINKSFDYEIEQSPNSKTLLKKEFPGGAIKYYYGEAILLLPFFTIADMITQTFDLSERTGYTFYYQLFVAIAGIFYLILGMLMIKALLLRMRYSDGVTAITLLLTFLATQLYNYSLHESAMSHVYSFAMIATLLNYYHLQLESYNSKRWLVIAFVATLIVFIRPVNALFILAFLPLSGSWQSSRKFIVSFFNSPKFIIVSSLSIAAIVALGQSYMYYLQTGNLWIYSYGGEGFNWTDPHFADVLFSYRKGLFVYTPILMFSLPGIWILAKRESLYWSVTWLVLMFLFLYVTSSWWYWAFGGSFGMRPFVDAYPLFVIPIAAFLELAFKNRLSMVFIVAVCTSIAGFQLFQTYQYITKVLPYEHMTKEKYWHLFLKSSNQFRYIYPPDHEFRANKQPGTLYLDKFVTKSDTVIELYANHDVEIERYELIADSWYKVMSIDSLRDTLYVEISGELFMEDATTDASFVIAFQENWQAYFWERKYLVHQVKNCNVWSPIRYILPLPQHRPNESHFSVSMHNFNSSKIKARKLRVRIFTE